jgi:hypothetical protein
MIRLWQGVRMRQVAASADPDSPPRLITLPVSWDDRAAAALAALVPGEGPVSLAASSAAWLSAIMQRARAAGEDEGIGRQLHALLRLRRMAPGAPLWRQDFATPGFILNLGAFFDPDMGFDVAGFGEAAALAARACRLLAPHAEAYRIGIAGLDDLLACLGIAYASRSARSLAACVAALFRARVDHGLEGPQRDLLATGADFPAPPAACPVAGLAEAAAGARAAVCCAPGSPPATGVFAAGPVEALLGIETGGIAPAFSPVCERHLTRASQDRLAAAGLSPEAALAAALLGETPLPSADGAAYAAMHDAVSRTLPMMPERPATLPCPVPEAGRATHPGVRHEPVPARHGGLTQKASVGGHRVFVRTAEYADGRLGDIAVALPREPALARGLMDCLSQAISIGLQHGVPLDAYVDSLALSDFGPAGLVEGDPAVGHASSPVDYVMRTLAANYLGRLLPEAEYAATGTEDASPLLPMDLPRGLSARARRRALKVVQ